MLEAVYETQELKQELYRIFAGVYADFRRVAASEYRFELEPLGYEDFISSVDKGLIRCVVLLENQIPTAFLVYTTEISEAIELNIIHCLGDEDLIQKRKVLLEKFLEMTEEIRKDKIVCYPMLGSQADFTADISHYGFKFIGLAVLRFMMNGTDSPEILENMKLKEKDDEYSITTWSDIHFEDAVKIIHNAFQTSSDALFDPRFKTEEGVRDILEKTVGNIYADFMPDATSVLLYHNQAVGFCFANLTGGKIVNIPLFAISKEHQGKGLSKYLIKKTLTNILEGVKSGESAITEINVSTETDNVQALKLYRNSGFKEDYSYPQSYLPESV